MTETNYARAGRGRGNGGEAYRNSSFWDSTEKKKQEKAKAPNNNKQDV